MRSSTSLSIGEIIADVNTRSCVGGESSVWYVEADESSESLALNFPMLESAPLDESVLL
jgi:hypothetical protein